MPLVRTIRTRGAVITTEVHAEVLFTPTGIAGQFSQKLTRRAKTAISARAPGNSRPTWGHEPAAHGKTLKRSFQVATAYRPLTMSVYSAVGSSALYAGFVDQGTGIYNGGSPWQAKILPPRTHGGADLYESTWRPGGHPVSEVWIKGQKPQRFFAKGLSDAFTSMGIARTSAGSVLGGITFPEGLARHVTASLDYGEGSAFRASLDIWRADRDAKWRSESAARSKAWRNTPRGRKLTADRQQRLADKRAAIPASARRPDYLPPRPARTHPTMSPEDKVKASIAASEKRLEREKARIANQRRAREMADNRRADQEAKKRAERVAANEFQRAKTEARAYAARLRPAYPGVEVLLSKKNGVARVVWTDSTGVTHRQDFR